ncbi:MAG TPA: ATPase domain-containing protein [Candidatus Bathyarchaeia archaeon]|nr:ATPase domain-containing protein [Candidatus Bathyarchaeia archaeon]
MPTLPLKTGSQVLSRRVSSGIPGLDVLLDGGFPEGKVVLVLGEPGTGKTILASQYLHSGVTRTGDKAVYVGMNEPKARFIAEMAGLGMDFSILENEGKFAYVDATEVRRIPEQAKVGRIPVGGRELGLVNLIDLVQEGIDKLSPKRVVVDSISDLVFRFPQIEERRPAVLDIVEVLQSTDTTCLLTSELPTTGEDRVLQPEEYLAEGVILLRTLRKGIRTLQVLKMRGSKVDTTPRPYVIKNTGLEVYATEEVYGQPMEK